MYKVLFRDKLLIKSLLSLSTKRVISFVYILFWSQKFSNSYPEAFSLLHSRIHNQKKLKATDCKASLLLATSGGRCITFLFSFFFFPTVKDFEKIKPALKNERILQKSWTPDFPCDINSRSEAVPARWRPLKRRRGCPRHTLLFLCGLNSFASFLFVWPPEAFGLSPLLKANHVIDKFLST